jgi:hypothetical protein
MRIGQRDLQSRPRHSTGKVGLHRALESGGTRRQHNVALIGSISLQPAGRLRVPYEDRRLAILTFTRAIRAAAS